MSPPTIKENTMKIEDFQVRPADTIQCPRCGALKKAALTENTGRMLRYAAVCQALLDTGGPCGTTLTLEATAHVFPLH